MFYQPIVHQGIKTIIYPFQGLEKVRRRGIEEMLGEVETIGKENKRDKPNKNEYSIVAAWNVQEDIMHDWFFFYDMPEWPGNPSVDSYVFKNGIVQPNERQVTCGSSLIMLGIEEQHRRKTTDREQYFSRRPGLPREISIGEQF